MLEEITILIIYIDKDYLGLSIRDKALRLLRGNELFGSQNTLVRSDLTVMHSHKGT